MWSNNRLLNLMEQLLGTKEIVGHPVWNLRTKTPKNEATTVPWHQGMNSQLVFVQSSPVFFFILFSKNTNARKLGMGKVAQSLEIPGREVAGKRS